MYQFNKQEQLALRKINDAYYMPPVLAKLEAFIQEEPEPTVAWKTAFVHMNRLMVESKDAVEVLLIERKRAGKIRDVSQARKAVVGQIFPKLLIYIFLQNKRCGNIDENIYITDNVRQKKFAEMTTIHVGGETQKPDMDILIYAQEKEVVTGCMVVSLKTSLRERAGQTYKWKLLLEIAQSDGTIKEKYDIDYPSKFVPLVCFATVNFYDEINSPQHRGMFKFFDQAFIAKQVVPQSEFVTPLSNLPEFVNERLSGSFAKSAS